MWLRLTSIQTKAWGETAPQRGGGGGGGAPSNQREMHLFTKEAHRTRHVTRGTRFGSDICLGVSEADTRREDVVRRLGGEAASGGKLAGVTWTSPTLPLPRGSLLLPLLLVARNTNTH